MKKKFFIFIFVSILTCMVFTGCMQETISKSYIGTYKLHSTEGFYLGQGTNDNDDMEYIFQVEPIDKSKTISDNIDTTEGITIKNSYTSEDKQKILDMSNKNISNENMKFFRSTLGKTNTVSVFAVTSKDFDGSIKTKYEYEIIINQDKIKDFDN